MGQRGMRYLGVLLVATVAAGCGLEGPDDDDQVDELTGAATAKDGLAQAYGIYKGLVAQFGEDQHHHIGFGFHPGLSTQRLLGPLNAPVGGQAILHFVSDFQGAAGTVEATLTGPANSGFDLYFVKNLVGSVKPESGDSIHKVGTFKPVAGIPTQYTLLAKIGSAAFPGFGVNFDLDMVVVTLKGKSPTSNIIATGARTLFEKRFFRERAGAALDPVSGTLSNKVETDDPLVRRGAQLFFNEKFSGNGRTCGTCHRLEDNLTIDPALVATLPSTDPLFVFPSGLEDRTLLKHALIRENLDGLDDPTHKFVERSVPHTLSLSTSLGEVLSQQRGVDDAITTHDDGPPSDQRTGWSADGAPGRGTLNEFAFGAVVQHFTKSLTRVPGTTFRIPTQAELDALEAFQLFSGRQKNPNIAGFTFGDAVATAGRDAVFGSANCAACHRDLRGDVFNFDFATGVENIPIPFRTATNMPKDGGFGVINEDPADRRKFVAGSLATGFGDAQFNVPPLYEAADTGPFFHNGGAATIEEAVNFYSTDAFLNSRGASFGPDQEAFPAQKPAIAGLLRTLNALTNIAQIRKRAQYLGGHTTSGGTTIVNVMIADSQDAIEDLDTPALTGQATADALQAMRTVKLLLENSLPFATQKPAVPMSQVQSWLQIARNDLLPGNPQNDF
jgi:hypothetical protein